MRSAFRNSIVLALSATGLSSAAQISPEKDDRRIIRKPAPVVVANVPYELKVETKPRFPNENRPASSTPVEEKSLSVTIQPEKTEFAGNGPLAFSVTFENKSKSPVMLSRLEQLGMSPKLVIANLDNTNQWSLTGKFPENNNAAAIQLGAGESKTYTLVVEGNVVIQPIPIPFPRPIPFPAQPLQERAGQQAPPIEAKQPKQILPLVRPPVVFGAPLPCGEGKCRARLLLEFQTDPLRKYRHPTWAGKIATGTVDFTVGKPNPIVVPPIGGGPVTKERAIQLAQAAAERALTANYQPVPGIKPAHAGNWISDAQKTATVKENPGGGWSIAWTEFPKKGFSLNVKIDVSASGATTVREVFTSYSE